MNSTISRRVALAALGGTAVSVMSACSAGTAKSAKFPNGDPIEMVIGWGAGGQVDIAVRTMQPLLKKELGTEIIVINKPGANTQLAAAEVAQAKPDGHTVGVLYGPQWIWTYLDPKSKAPYDQSSFDPLGMVQRSGAVLAVHADSEYQDIGQFVDAAKAKPESLTYGVTGPLSVGNAVATLLAQKFDAELDVVNFADGPSLQNALLGKHIDSLLVNPAVAAPQVQAGKWRALAVAGSERNPLLPDTPTMTEGGFDIALPNSYGFVVPTGTPNDVSKKLQAAVKVAAKDPKVIKDLEEQGNNMLWEGPEGYRKYWGSLEPDAKEFIKTIRGSVRGGA